MRSNTPGRVPQLDAIRGVAALIVVLFHCWNTLPWKQCSLLSDGPVGACSLGLWTLAFKLTPLRIITAGPASVGVFFILSGLVLAFPFVNGRRESYSAFLVKRFFRLYPPFAVAILLSALLREVVQPQMIDHLSDWFNRSWDEPVTGAVIAGHLAMLGLDRYQQLDNVMWSLVHEVRLSVVFPLLAIATIRAPRAAVITAVLLLCGLSVAPAVGFIRNGLATGDVTWPFATLLSTARYMIYFVGGIVLAQHFDALVAANRSARRLTRGCLWVVASVLLLSKFGSLGDLAWAAGAALMIISCLGSARASRLLLTVPAQWLGKVSYSLYLVHVPMLLTIIHLLQGSRVQLVAIFFVPAISLIAAQLFFVCVERPSHRLAHYFGRGRAERLHRNVTVRTGS